jgi:hypothetical protein
MNWQVFFQDLVMGNAARFGEAVHIIRSMLLYKVLCFGIKNVL